LSVTGSIVGDSPAWRKLVAELAAVASTNAPVLIQGETGTGKELVARALHGGSSRRERPLVKVN
jgi:transcriptional regulator with GAF, ATPase, and Fis domain